MTESTNRVRVTIRRTVFLSGLSCLGSVSLFTGSVAAQTPVGEPIAEPTESLAPAPVAPAAIAPPEPMPQDGFPAEFSPAPRSIPSSPVAAPAPLVSAPDAYIAPNTIIFSERSTGCRATMSAGQVPTGGACGGGGGQLGTTTVPALMSPSVQPARFGGAQPSVVNMATGIGATPSLRDFYRRTVRPPARLGNGNVRLIFPLSIPAPISSIFGWRVHPITGDARFHTGTDLAAPLGTPVLAAFAGQVAIADFLGGYGLAVAIDHNRGAQQSLYAHLSEVFVKAGDSVKQGDVIGRVGSTGNSTGPHLHFEFRQQTADGWVALDAGEQLEYALAQLVRSLEIAQATSTPVRVNAGAQGTIQ